MAGEQHGLGHVEAALEQEGAAHGVDGGHKHVEVGHVDVVDKLGHHLLPVGELVIRELDEKVVHVAIRRQLHQLGEALAHQVVEVGPDALVERGTNGPDEAEDVEVGDDRLGGLQVALGFEVELGVVQKGYEGRAERLSMAGLTRVRRGAGLLLPGVLLARGSRPVLCGIR